jgi:DNA-binding response OmpR family regulator
MSKILLVEDDQEVGESITTWLENESYTVEMTSSGSDASQLLENFWFDLIILDWGLPDLSGYEVLQKFRERGGNTPVIFITARADMDSKTAGLDCGADDYLPKPFSPRELLARVRAILRRPGPRTSVKELSLANLRLHPDTGRIFIDDMEVRLSGKEFAVLSYLLQHQNQACSPRTLLKEVWESETEVTEDSVRKLVSRLRQRLSACRCQVNIKTEAGHGYTLEPEIDC